MNPQLTAKDLQARDRLRFEVGTSYKILDAEDECTVRGMLFDDRKYISQPGQEIHRLEYILSNLHKTRENCIARMDRCAVALSPQKYIPPEILATIFVHSICDRPTVLPPSNREAPWVLLWVCS